MNTSFFSAEASRKAAYLKRLRIQAMKRARRCRRPGNVYSAVMNARHINRQLIAALRDAEGNT